MGTVIRQRRIAPDSWQRLETGHAAALPDGELIVPLERWRAERGSLRERPGRIGVWLEGHDDPETIAPDLDRLALVALHVPKFLDGRAYSSARQLRERYRYGGELRAFGDVGRDALLGLERVGFDAFELRDGEDAETALAAFDELEEQYQGSATQPLPLFRRRLKR